jgi:hypothetical protein
MLFECEGKLSPDVEYIQNQGAGSFTLTTSDTWER